MGKDQLAVAGYRSERYGFVSRNATGNQTLIVEGPRLAHAKYGISRKGSGVIAAVPKSR